MKPRRCRVKGNERAHERESLAETYGTSAACVGQLSQGY
jgi:hypothetical protein